MDKIHELTELQVLIFAAQFASDSNVDLLRLLAVERKDVLTKELLYRTLLTFWSIDESGTTSILGLLRDAEDGFSNFQPLDSSLNLSPFDTLPTSDRFQRIRLLSLISAYGNDYVDRDDLIAQLIISWTHRLESLGGSLAISSYFVQEFGERSPDLLAWAQAYLQPILRLDYELYPGDSNTIKVQELESMTGNQGISALLRCTLKASGKKQIARDLDEVVAPWIQGSQNTKRRRLDSAQDDQEDHNPSWEDVNEWLLSRSIDDIRLTADVILEWQGPISQRSHEDGDDVQQASNRYAQTALAIIYANDEAGADIISISKRILNKVTAVTGLKPPDLSNSLPEIPMSASRINIDPADFLRNALLRQQNSLTHISQPAVDFLAGVLATAEMLNSFKLPLSIAEVAKVCSLASVEQQKLNLRKILQQVPRLTSAETNWHNVRRQIFWLRSWQVENPSADSRDAYIAYLSHLDAPYMDGEILDAILGSGKLDAAADMYCRRKDSPLPLSEVEKRIVAAMFEAFDNSSNGNQNRGGMKRANDILKTFQAYFPESEDLRQIDHLIKATHSLSFYQLTLQHGVPFQPVNIRVHKDPLALIDKVLQQDSKAYTKLDDLIEIGRNLLLAGLPFGPSNAVTPDSMELKILSAQYKITYLAINSALKAHDFDTAYSYITTRVPSSSPNSTSSAFIDDTSWRAAYAAGRYRPPTSPQSLHSQISSLSKRMDLLSLALTLAPSSDSLSEVLGTWRRCEEEMDGLKSQAIEEERTFEAQSAGIIPGGFDSDDQDLDTAETRQIMARRNLAENSATYEEEAPIGLFDVARGAANALHRSAFPLAGVSRSGFKVANASSGPSNQTLDSQSIISQSPANEGERIRKRDMVSNMVTGGLMSGMGWVLGAQPVEKSEANK